MVHTSVLRIFGSGGTTTLSSDGLSVKDTSNVNVLEVTKDKIALKDLSLSSTADEDILFSAKGEKVMSLSTDEHVLDYISDTRAAPYYVHNLMVTGTEKFAKYIMGANSKAKYSGSLFEVENTTPGIVNPSPGVGIGKIKINGVDRYFLNTCLALWDTQTANIPYLSTFGGYMGAAGPIYALYTDADPFVNVDAMIDAVTADQTAFLAPMKADAAFDAMLTDPGLTAHWPDQAIAETVIFAFRFGVWHWNASDFVQGASLLAGGVKAAGVVDSKAGICKIGNFLMQQTIDLSSQADVDAIVAAIKATPPSTSNWALSVDEGKFDANNNLLPDQYSVTLYQCDEELPSPHPSIWLGKVYTSKLLDPNLDPSLVTDLVGTYTADTIEA